MDVHTDLRKEKEADTMENWDDQKLAEVVTSKQGQNANLPTEIVCKYFIDAIRNKKYGWFWDCPNGIIPCLTARNNLQIPACAATGLLLEGSGQDVRPGGAAGGYRDCVGARAKQLEDEGRRHPGDQGTVFEVEVRQRQFPSSNPAAVARAKAEAEASEQRTKDIKAGRAHRSGRELFVFNPNLFVDDDDAADGKTYATREEDHVSCTV